MGKGNVLALDRARVSRREVQRELAATREQLAKVTRIAAVLAEREIERAGRCAVSAEDLRRVERNAGLNFEVSGDRILVTPRKRDAGPTEDDAG